MSLVRLSHRDRRAVLIGLVLTVPVAGFRLGAPALRAGAHSEQRLSEERRIFAQELGLLGGLDRIEAAIASADRSVARLKPVMRETDSGQAGPIFAAYLRHAALGNGVHVIALEEADPPQTRRMEATAMVISAETDLQGLLDFLTELEGPDGLVTVEALEVEARPADGQQSDAAETLAVRIRVRSYWLDPAELQPAGARTGETP